MLESQITLQRNGRKAAASDEREGEMILIGVPLRSAVIMSNDSFCQHQLIYRQLTKIRVERTKLCLRSMKEDAKMCRN